MTAFYIVIGITAALSILTIVSLLRTANKNRPDWRRVESGKDSKDDPAGS